MDLRNSLNYFKRAVLAGITVFTIGCSEEQPRIYFVESIPVREIPDSIGLSRVININPILRDGILGANVELTFLLTKGYNRMELGLNDFPRSKRIRITAYDHGWRNADDIIDDAKFFEEITAGEKTQKLIYNEGGVSYKLSRRNDPSLKELAQRLYEYGKARVKRQIMKRI